MDPMLPDHDHCRYCGDAVPFEQAYCCEECYYADQKRMPLPDFTALVIIILCCVEHIAS